MNGTLKKSALRSSFVQAAHDMVLTEAVRNVSILKIAGPAGYAVTTLYQYFQGLDALLQKTKY